MTKCPRPNCKGVLMYEQQETMPGHWEVVRACLFCGRVILKGQPGYWDTPGKEGKDASEKSATPNV